MVSTSVAPVDRRAAMVDRPGAVLRFLFKRLFAAIEFGEAEAARIRDAAARGPVVYVLRTVSYIEYLYFNYALSRHGLPLARFANGGVRTVLLWPVRVAFVLAVALWRLARGARLEPEEATVARFVESGQAVLLFLRPYRHFLGDARAAARVRGRFMETLIELQRRLGARGRALQLVPMALIWGHPAIRPGGRGTLDALFGEPESPGRIRAFWQFVRHHRSSVVKVAEPIDLREFLRGEPDRTDEGLARRLRFELSGSIERERRVLVGPPAKTPRRVRWEVMRSRRLAETIGRMPGDRQANIRKAERYLLEIAAMPTRWMFEIVRRLLSVVFARIYEGIDIDEAGLERIREAARRGPLLILPSHRSHVDYLIASYTFYERQIAPPHIAAGANLTFFPMGFIFRHAGAFFLRRSFHGNVLYSAVFSAYVRRLLRDGFNLEFFIEGTRSRTGKALPPRLGLLGIVADAVVDGDAPNLQAVPIAISYEKVVEEGSYAAEAVGGEKKKESFGALLKARRVLRSRYGRIDMQVGELFSVADALAEAGAPRGADESARRQAVRRLGHRVIYNMARATAVTPSALVASAALAGGGRALPRRELDRRIRWLADVARDAGARFAAALVDDMDGALGRAIDLLASDGDLELRGAGDDQLVVVVDERRSRLEFYKNNAIHALGDASIVARAVLAAGAPERAAVRDKALTASRLLKRELVYRPGKGFDAVFAETLGELERRGWLRQAGGDRIEITENGRTALPILAGLTASYLESYRVVVRALAAHPEAGHKELLAAGERAFLLGEITRREAVSRPIFESAVAFLKEGGVARDPAKLAQLEAELRSVETSVT